MTREPARQLVGALFLVGLAAPALMPAEVCAGGSDAPAGSFEEVPEEEDRTPLILSGLLAGLALLGIVLVVIDRRRDKAAPPAATRLADPVGPAASTHARPGPPAAWPADPPRPPQSSRAALAPRIVRVSRDAATDLGPLPQPEVAGEASVAEAGEAVPWAAAGPRLVLEGMPGQVYPLQRDELFLGHEPGNHICLSDGRVSGFHATIRRRGREMLLIDQDSTNGTLLNGELIGPWQQVPLAPGDRITLGPYVLRYEV